jgi:hypothetical protein
MTLKHWLIEYPEGHISPCCSFLLYKSKNPNLLEYSDFFSGPLFCGLYGLLLLTHFLFFTLYMLTVPSRFVYF